MLHQEKDKCGTELQRWNRKKRDEWTREMRTARKELAALSRANDPSLWRALKEVEHKINCLNEKEEQYWRQRSRALWLKCGDKNSRYFHHKASARRKKNMILGMKDSMGCWQSEEVLVEKIICDYFKNLFTSNKASDEEIELALEGMEPKIDQDMNRILEEPFSEDEVRQVAKNMNPTKAPGIDGLPALFY